MQNYKYNKTNKEKRDVLQVKWYYHTIIIMLLLASTLLFYNNGLGAIPFFFATVYLACLTVKEYKKAKRSKRM